ncbi:MAG: hypothetical protein DHS20C17_25390 [Cyclobacteriaceae bacterium]|nr:MAG: hypothetical protein DHS20C17_25390 [Cyclobacteriaceae bacterium]
MRYTRDDDNIFFSALIVFTLQQLKSSLPLESIPPVERLIENVIANYSRYRHYADTTTYNFWQQRRDGHFPNGLLLKRLSFFALAADADDTSVIYLTDPSDNAAETIKTTLEAHYPGNAPISPITPAAYQDLKPYPTFLGKKVKREMDVCVVCNVLYLVFRNNLPLSSTDTDSLEFIQRVLELEDYREAAFFVSPNYGSPAVILYHIARIAGTFHHQRLKKIETLLIECLRKEYQKSNTFMESLLLRISLLRFKIITPLLKPNRGPEHYFKDFYFFQAGMLTSLQYPWLNRLANASFFHLKYRCDAYYWTLWLEYHVLYQRAIQDHQVLT